MSFSVTLLSIAFIAAALYVSGVRKKNRLSTATWDLLVHQLEALPMTGVTKVALDYLQPAKGQNAIETDEMWQLVGGAEGLERMQMNARILLQLAAFAEQWNREESLVVGERMRREAQILRRAIKKIQRGVFWGYGRATGPFVLQQAASTYYLMRQRTLALYETSHIGRHARLSIALGDALAAYGPAF
jgi:hypothetical protein